MVARVVLAGGIAVLVSGGVIAAGRWRDSQVAGCEQRGTRLAALDLFERRPAGFEPEQPYAGCDTERIVAYAGRDFVATGGLDEAAVRGFYRDQLAGERWTIVHSTAAPGRDKAALCAAKDLSSGTARVSLTFPLPGMYALSVADAGDSGTDCG